jgi:hypothetical protein
MAMRATAGMLPPCGHACQATVLVDEGLQQPQMDVSASPAASTCSSIHEEQREPAESLQCVLAQPRQTQKQPYLQDECQCPQAQADAAAALLYCGAGLPNAYLAITFDQLLLLSMGRSVELVQDSASSAGTPCIICRKTVCHALVAKDSVYVILFWLPTRVTTCSLLH